MLSGHSSVSSRPRVPSGWSPPLCGQQNNGPQRSPHPRPGTVHPHIASCGKGECRWEEVKDLRWRDCPEVGVREQSKSLGRGASRSRKRPGSDSPQELRGSRLCQHLDFSSETFHGVLPNPCSLQNSKTRPSCLLRPLSSAREPHTRPPSSRLGGPGGRELREPHTPLLFQKHLGLEPVRGTGHFHLAHTTRSVLGAAPHPGTSPPASGTPPGQKAAYPTGTHHTAGLIQTAA